MAADETLQPHFYSDRKIAWLVIEGALQHDYIAREIARLETANESLIKHRDELSQRLINAQLQSQARLARFQNLYASNRLAAEQQCHALLQKNFKLNTFTNNSPFSVLAQIHLMHDNKWEHHRTLPVKPNEIASVNLEFHARTELMVTIQPSDTAAIIQTQQHHPIGSGQFVTTQDPIIYETFNLILKQNPSTRAIDIFELVD